MANSTIKYQSAYPNYASGEVGSLLAPSAQHTCVKDSVVVGYIQKTSNGQATVYINGYGLIGTSNDVTFRDVYIPVRAGDTVTTRANSGAYALYVYSN